MMDERKSTVSIQSSGTAASKKNLYRFAINDTVKNNEHYHFANNEINTKKYNIFTFLPKSLFYQFKRPANIYFLVCAILQCIPQISPLGAETAMIPIIIVLAVSLIREAIEDCNRARLDREQNNEPTDVYLNGNWVNTISGKLNMGELVLVKQDDTFPADLILIDSELNDGICFIETGTLDGEKTLKQKEAPPKLAGKFNIKGKVCEKINISGECIADEPNPELYQLNGRMNVNFGTEATNNNIISENVPLDAKQLLLKGAKLKNTGWIIGIVVYAGHNCKIMKNAKDAVTKFSTLEYMMNKGLYFIFALQFVFCVLAAILRGVFYNSNNLEPVDRNPKGFGYTKYRYAIESFLNYFTYLLLLNTMIPISLIITLEIAKMIQGCFMRCDELSYSKVRKKWLCPNSVSLNEECGIVDYIFSDKTGTLTCNKMVFKYCVIGDVCYQYLRGELTENSDQEKNLRQTENIIPINEYEMHKSVMAPGSVPKIANTQYPNYIIRSSSDPNVCLSLENSKDLIENFWYALALCHSCSIQRNEGVEDYICVSPDSIELVKAAKAQGFYLTDSGSSKVRRLKLGENKNEVKDIELLQLIEFSSDRKRESVIIKEGNLIKLYCKGADSIIKERLSKNTPQQILKQCNHYVDKFSSQGFRTLFIAMKVLSQQEYDTFAQNLSQAMLAVENKDEQVARVYETIENDLYLLGTTIVEDKLQENVPETIRDLRLAGIKIWMLTGDKMNTAYNIALSCNLINTNMKIFEIKGVEVVKDSKMKVINNDERDQVILDFAKDFQKYKGEYNSMETPKFGILVDEKALLTINEKNNKEMQKIFLDIAKNAEAVICCRVSPLQKSQVVKMMKNYNQDAVTLAIGDGGNDVSMILEAHIGVGIYGEEGMRAVQSSDFAIGEFQCLRPLLLFHGRTNYVRNAELIMYFFYKNFVFTLPQFLYGFYCNFTGQSILDDWFITLYNMLFTSLPLGARALLDHDVKPSDGIIVDKMLPFLYYENRMQPVFTFFSFFLSLLLGALHCIINYFTVVYLLYSDSVNSDGNMAGLWFLSVNIFTNVLIIVSVDLIIYTKYHTYINVLIMGIFTFLFYIIFLIIVHNVTYFNSVGTMVVAFGSGRLWMSIIFVCGTCALIDYVILSVKFVFFRTLVRILQILVSERGKLNDQIDLPPEIQEKLNYYNEFEKKEEDLTKADYDYKFPYDSVQNSMSTNPVVDPIINSQIKNNNINNNIIKNNIYNNNIYNNNIYNNNVMFNPIYNAPNISNDISLPAGVTQQNLLLSQINNGYGVRDEYLPYFPNPSPINENDYYRNFGQFDYGYYSGSNKYGGYIGYRKNY